MFVKNEVELKFLRIEKLEGQNKPDWGEHEYDIVYRAKSLDELYGSKCVYAHDKSMNAYIVDHNKLDDFNSALENSERDIKLDFEGEIFTEGTNAVIKEYFIDTNNDLQDEKEKQETIDILMFDTEQEINRILSDLDQEFIYMNKNEQFEKLYNSFKGELHTINSASDIERRIMVFKGSAELTEENEKLAQAFFDSMKEEIEQEKILAKDENII